MFENVEIKNMRTLCINLADSYVTIVYAGNVDQIRQFMMSIVSVTEGGADLASSLHTIEEIKEILQDLTLGRPDPVINEFLKCK